MVSRFRGNAGISTLRGTRDIPLVAPALLQCCASPLCVSTQPQSGDSLSHTSHTRTYTSTVLPPTAYRRVAPIRRTSPTLPSCPGTRTPCAPHVEFLSLSGSSLVFLSDKPGTTRPPIASLIEGTHELGCRSALYNTLHGLPTTRLFKEQLT